MSLMCQSMMRDGSYVCKLINYKILNVISHTLKQIHLNKNPCLAYKGINKDQAYQYANVRVRALDTSKHNLTLIRCGSYKYIHG